MTPLRGHAREGAWNQVLVELYGEAVALGMADRVIELLAEGASAERGPREAGWDERDAWVIAYPDQFRQPGRAPLATLRDVYGDLLARFCNGLHVLPFFPSSSDSGYAITDYLAVDPGLGSWEDIEALAASGRLMVDGVVNHASAHGRWFEGWRSGNPEYAGFFRTGDPGADLSAVVRAREHPLLTPFDTSSGEQWVWTTFSSDQADLDYRNPEVLLCMLDVLLGYAGHGAAMIRLDAVGFLWKEESSPSIHLEQTHLIIQFFRACLAEVFPDIMIVTETNVPHSENISYLGPRRAEAHGVYQFPLPPLTLAAYERGDASHLVDWLGALESTPSGRTFLNFLASHDGVGLRPIEHILSSPEVDELVVMTRRSGGRVNRRMTSSGTALPYELNATWYDLVRGGTSDEDALVRHLGSHAIMLALAGIPLIYVHSFFGTSNDLDAVTRTGEARAINRTRCDDVGALRDELSRPTTRAATIFAGMSEMLMVRRSFDAFHPDADQEIMNMPQAVIGVARRGRTSSAQVLVNVADHPTDLKVAPAACVLGKRAELDGTNLLLGPWGSAWLIDAD